MAACTAKSSTHELLGFPSGEKRIMNKPNNVSSTLYGIACNHCGCSEIRAGAKCYIAWLNPGNGSDRVQIWCRSRSGRSIVKIEDIRKLSKFRCVWLPEHVRNDQRIMEDTWYEKEHATKIAEAFNARSKTEQTQPTDQLNAPEQAIVMVLRKSHRYRERITGLYRPGDDVYDPILLIEYCENKPHSVITAWDCWDVDWCKRDQMMYFHLSGGKCQLNWTEHSGGFCHDRGCTEYRKSTVDGQVVEFHGKVDIDLKYSREIVWVNRHFVNVANDAGKTILDSPIDLGDGVVNPFLHNDFGGDTPTVYCSTCDDNLPDDDLCDHLDWCEEHCTYKGSTPDGCGCKIQSS